MIHPRHIERTLAKLKKIVDVYLPYVFETVDVLQVRCKETDEHLYTVPAEDAAWKPAARGMVWGKPGGSIWFKGSYVVPNQHQGQPLYIRATTDGRETLFWIDGKPRGIFNEGAKSEMLGNHRTLLLTSGAAAGTRFDLAFESYAGHPIVGAHPYMTYENNNISDPHFDRTFQSIEVVVRREEVKDFVFDLWTLNQLVESEHVAPFRKAKVQNALVDVFQVVVQDPSGNPEHVWRPALERARRIMQPLLEQKNSHSAPSVGIIGHSHMDTAWLWTRDETIRKCARTYSNALRMMEQYPEYTFVQSSAFHAELMRRHYPDIFQGIQQRVKEGRWEPNGGVWIEPDCNMTSGESLVRQFLKGQQYTREQFGYTADAFWLPDTFGYSAAIPQIMKGFGIDYFLTTKLSWNDTNPFPFDTFRWRGLDGTTVLTHFNVIHCWPDAKSLLDNVYGVQHKQVNDRRLVAYGYGDGGGGPQYDMLETARRVRDLEGVPKAQHTTVSRFMRELEATSVNVPVYVGELYFEGHRGTLTQLSQIKRNNRKAEIALRNLELLEVITWLNETGGPVEEKEQLYELLLINQFHDILPGTSIPEVHDRAIREVREVIDSAEHITSQLMGQTVRSESKTATLWNTLSWARTGQLALNHVSPGLTPADPSLPAQWVVDITGKSKLFVGGLELPALGAKSISLEPGTPAGHSPFRFDGSVLETPFAHVTFDEHGYIASFIDRTCGRELRGKGLPLNAFLMGEDVPLLWDNWDIDPDQQSKLQLQTELVSREVVADGALQFRIRSVYQIGQNSTLKQDMVFYADSPRVNFETVIDWKDSHQLLKVGFDVNILSQTARHEIQFGHAERPTHRNTPYEQAMFEVCNHKWTDLSENRYGVAILNDCKYGISVEGSDLRLTLHKGGTHPDPRGDHGVHEVTYTFLPHNSGFSAESVIRPAYELNVPVLSTSGALALQEPCVPLVEVDAPNVIVEAVKPAESDKAYVVRLYEAERSAVIARLTFGQQPKRVVITNLLEEAQQELHLEGSVVSLDIRAFEIKTIKVYF